jgi:formate hydrogenlyase subunit 6/NADH:ubiquinone oxidoreductase subunit I
MNVIDKNNLGKLLQKLSEQGYTIFGPKLGDGAIIYDEISNLNDLPAGWTDEQDAGKYRLKQRKDAALFGYVIGPHSWKKFLFPSRLKIMEAIKTGKSFEIKPLNGTVPKYAFLGVRSCELNAIFIQDKVFNNSMFSDSYYNNIRKNSLIIAVNCTHAAKTCFCVSMKTGPKVLAGYDIALTEIINEKEHYFTLETGSKKGEELAALLELKPAGETESNKQAKAILNAEQKMGRQLDTADIKELFYNNLENHQWSEVATRCLSCANCTMVCPTCFCSNVEDVTDLTGEHAERWRRWDSCFSLDYSKVSGGNFRTSVRSRYRQWITHKLASWIDQFGTSGCVGCGRCISWCPAGIDITEEVKKLRSNKKLTS